MKNQYAKSFAAFACAGDTITAELEGFTVTARLVFDQDHQIDDDDCHNPDQMVTGCDDEQFSKLLAARAAWFADEWFYVGVVLSVSRAGVVLDKHAASLWGIECNYPGGDNSYLTEVANELLTEAIEAGRAKLAALLAS